MTPTFIFSILLLQLLFASQPCHLILTSAADGRWQLLQKSIGVSAMHMQLLRNDRVVMFDRTDFGKSNLPLPNGKCRTDPTDTALKVDCTAHSVEYNVLTNKFRALTVQTDVWCSSGAIMPDGNLVQTGGFNDGERRVRVFSPCSTCDWQEIPNGLAAKRWYASNHVLPNGKQIIVGGRGQFNYEFIPQNVVENTIKLPFLSETNDRGVENNLYPFVFLNVDGNLFIFANNRAILLDYVNNKVVKTYPTIPGGDPRSYPSTGSKLPPTVGCGETLWAAVDQGCPLGAPYKCLVKERRNEGNVEEGSWPGSWLLRFWSFRGR
ncbi:aldehyde oxidase GLOX-like [Herrania umbratica]|uniref:Aldehyde oxidase GLOX-like n=1 Tax=Herrania umbratica TaxID=108875 RepID=A0A6J1ABP7_9ROSI|nr:aldehyde oxidase GLOX-like [Herrania umbratica]